MRTGSEARTTYQEARTRSEARRAEASPERDQTQSQPRRPSHDQTQSSPGSPERDQSHDTRPRPSPDQRRHKAAPAPDQSTRTKAGRADQSSSSHHRKPYRPPAADHAPPRVHSYNRKRRRPDQRPRTCRAHPRPDQKQTRTPRPAPIRSDRQPGRVPSIIPSGAHPAPRPRSFHIEGTRTQAGTILYIEGTRNAARNTILYRRNPHQDAPGKPQRRTGTQDAPRTLKRWKDPNPRRDRLSCFHHPIAGRSAPRDFPRDGLRALYISRGAPSGPLLLFVPSVRAGIFEWLCFVPQCNRDIVRTYFHPLTYRIIVFRP